MAYQEQGVLMTRERNMRKIGVRFGPRAVPARSGRAKTRAWMIFQGCWRGPHAATGDRSRSATSARPTHGQRMVDGEPRRFFLERIGDHEPHLHKSLNDE